MISKKYIAIALCLVMITATTACSSSSGQTTEVEMSTGTPVKVKNIEQNTLKIQQTFASKTASSEQVMVFPVSPGIVDEVYYEVGDEVKKDDVLFSIDSTQLDNQLKEAYKGLEQANLAISMQQESLNLATGAQYDQQLSQLEQMVINTEIGLENAQKAYEDTKVLYESGAVSEQQFTNVESSYKQAQVAYDTAKLNYDLYVGDLSSSNTTIAEAQLQQAQLQKEQLLLQIQTLEDAIDDTDVKSPINGVVTTATVVDEQIVSTQNPAYVIVQTDKILVDVGVTENIIKSINKGDQVDVYVSAVSEEAYRGAVTNVGIAPDQQRGKYMVTVEIDNTSGEIYPGMFAEVIFTTKQQSGLLVSVDAVLTDEEGQYVYVVNENRSEKRYITPGINDGQNMIILDGIQEGEILVGEGQNYIGDGDQLEVVVN
ncbi:efflux RND transporter periplasmic adaptor subunit [Vallitalea okinawensis]|uniref:efflux RND transporter periplasmic adaptor subunit n=1 Tax=Vallitalea okinawensis TaxID=2078660 RepID=UPI000CFD6238|nr:efflux RND transporter periplasmic adaptor subunit [Vallitalea okinawensis]